MTMTELRRRLAHQNLFQLLSFIHQCQRCKRCRGLADRTFEQARA